MADIAKFNDEMERSINWSLGYYEKWETLPNKQHQSALTQVWEHPSIEGVYELIKEGEAYKKLVKQGGKEAAKKAAVSSLNRLMAQEIVKASVGGAVSATGRRGAVIVVKETTRLAATRGANIAVSGFKLASLPVGISSTVGEIVGDFIANQAGVENYHIKNALGAGGAIAGGATAGLMVGGPLGAAAGAAASAGSWAVAQGIKALLHTKKGPDDNWCYIEIGDIGKNTLCVGTYAGDDSLYWKTYWNEYKTSGSEWEMSAGQPQTGKFQLCIWHKNHVIKHFDDVYYRDTFGIIKQGHKFRVVHCRGEYHPHESGKVFVFDN